VGHFQNRSKQHQIRSQSQFGQVLDQKYRLSLHHPTNRIAAVSSQYH